MISKLSKIIAFTNIWLLILLYLACLNSPCQAGSDWTKVNQESKKKVFQLNVGLKLRLKNDLWVQIVDLSAKQHYYVFSTSSIDCGYQVVGRGSCFPVSINQGKEQKLFFVTSHHVLDNADQLKAECEMFYAALELYASQTAKGNNAQLRYQDLLKTINLSKKSSLSSAEKSLYQKTVDAIWDCYDTYLSKRADPGSILFNKYKALASLKVETGYFIHAPGAVTNASIIARGYKISSSPDPDLALLTVNPNAKTVSDLNILALNLDQHLPITGQEVEAIGYPIAAENLDLSPKYYAPTITTGKITKITAQMIQFKAQISKGNSGGPLISQTGGVLGVVTAKLPSNKDNQGSNYGSAIKANVLKTFILELLDNKKDQKLKLIHH